MSYIKYFFLLVIFLLSLLFNHYYHVNKIKVGHNLVILNEISKNYYKKNLPIQVFEFFNKNYLDRLTNLDCTRNDKTCWLNYDPRIEEKSGVNKEEFFYKSSNIFLNNSNYSDLVNYIDLKNLQSLKINAINNLDFNFYNQDNNSKINNRNFLPFFVYYELPSNYKSKKLCWKGNIFLKDKSELFNRIFNNEYQCKEIFNNSPNIKFFAASDGSQNDLIIKFSTFNFYFDIFSSILFLVLSLVLFFNLNIKNFLKSFIFFSFTILVLLYVNKNFDFGFSIFSAGNDGILYMSYSNKLYQYLSNLNLYDFFKGMESIFYFPSSLRYFWVINKIFFGDTIYGYLLVILIMPYLVFIILRNIISSKILIIIFSILFFGTRVFEGYSFSNITMIQHVYAGDAEPLAIFLFLVSLILFMKIEKNKYKCLSVNYFVIGFILFLSVSLRPNYLPTAFLLFIIIILRNYFILRLNLNIFFLIVGFGFIILLPMHNYFYGNEFYLLSSGAHHNTHAPINLWFNLFKNIIFYKNYETQEYVLILKQISRWIKPMEIHYIIIFLIAMIFAIFSKNFVIFSFGLLALSQHAVCLIYEPEGRYAYLAWFLTFIIFIYYLSYLQGHIKKKFFHLL